MNEVDALELVQAAIWTIIVASGPAVGLAMVLGIAIALLQAVTQIQEVTLTFVPKILAVFAGHAADGAICRLANLYLHRTDLPENCTGILTKPPH